MAEPTMRDEWSEWEALDERVGAWEVREGPPLSDTDEARHGALLEAFKDAHEPAAAVVRLLRASPAVHQAEALRSTLAMMRELHTRVGLVVPLWIGLAQDRLDHGDD
ncbi:MAG TPA: hypothetical protein VEY30_10435 [Myxococcaceae bacterium]|nr:hypothetical protein [Myxococcaceae bacterium]